MQKMGIRLTGNRLVIVMVLLCAAMASGMGGLTGEGGPTRIPIPEKNFSVTIIDMADVHTTVTMFSIGGYVHFMGNKGKGQLAVPFTKVKRADIRHLPKGLEVVLTLKDGQQVALSGSRGQECYGSADIGNFKITMGDIKSIVFGREITGQ